MAHKFIYLMKKDSTSKSNNTTTSTENTITDNMVSQVAGKIDEMEVILPGLGDDHKMKLRVRKATVRAQIARFL